MNPDNYFYGAHAPEQEESLFWEFLQTAAPAEFEALRTKNFGLLLDLYRKEFNVWLLERRLELMQADMRRMRAANDSWAAVDDTRGPYGPGVRGLSGAGTRRSSGRAVRGLSGGRW